ncbi:MAG: prepilin peptidase [Chloroflexi bacterium]|nr:prepilin peptidase [Chloroflexota bacterium]
MAAAEGSLVDALRLSEYALLGILALATIYCDWRWNRIPNVITYPVMLAGLVLGTFAAFPGAVGEIGTLDRVAAIVGAFVVLYPFYAGRLMLAGDLKFLMAVGALRGVSFLLAAVFYGAIVGGVIALLYMLLARRRLAPPDAEPTAAQAAMLQLVPARLRPLMGSKMPMGIGLAIGAIIVLVREVVTT